MAAPTRLGHADHAVGGVGNATFNASAVPNGSWMIAMLSYSDTGGVIDAVPPEGWTALWPGKQSIGTRAMQAWGRIKQAGDSTFEWATTAGTAKRVHVMWGEGAGPVNQWVIGLVGVRAAGNVIPGQSVQAGNSTTTTCPPITVGPETLVLGLSVEATSAAEADVTGHTGATRWFFDTEINPPSIETLFAAYIENTSGTTPAISVTYPNVQGNNSGGVQIGLVSQDAPEPPPVPGLPVKIGTGAGARVSVIDEEGERVTPKSLRVLFPGFENINQMLDTPGFTWGHRGNSIQWPEMSMHAYTQTVRRGYGVLEISMGRTSDGVWFGLHDETLNRTSGVTGLPPAIQMTWAQVQEYQNVHGAQDSPQPYMRWEEFRDTYGSTHVIVMDPKHSVLAHAPARQEFVALMEEIGNDRAIFKFSGDATWLADIYSGAGFHTWGYYYQTGFTSGSLANTQGAWSLLGMDHTATQEAWDAVTSYSKPVIGHIAATQTHYNTAIAKGADGVQCSGTHVIEPVSWWT